MMEGMFALVQGEFVDVATGQPKLPPQAVIRRAAEILTDIIINRGNPAANGLEGRRPLPFCGPEN